MMFAAVVEHRSGRAPPSLRDAHNGNARRSLVGKPSIGTETLFRPTRPPLSAIVLGTIDKPGSPVQVQVP